MYYINNEIMRRANKLSYIPKTVAPSTEIDLFNCPTLVIWTGASDSTIFQDTAVNCAFRALHDALHLKTRVGFSPQEEMYFGGIQANMFDSDLMRELVFSEVSGQARYYLETGKFVGNQIEFAMNALKGVLK